MGLIKPKAIEYLVICRLSEHLGIQAETGCPSLCGGISYNSVCGHIPVQKEKYYVIGIKKWLFGYRLLHLYTESYLPLAGKQIYLNLYTDICLPLADKYILKPCSGRLKME